MYSPPLWLRVVQHASGFLLTLVVIGMFLGHDIESRLFSPVTDLKVEEAHWAAGHLMWTVDFCKVRDLRFEHIEWTRKSLDGRSAPIVQVRNETTGEPVNVPRRTYQTGCYEIEYSTPRDGIQPGDVISGRVWYDTGHALWPSINVPFSEFVVPTG